MNYYERLVRRALARPVGVSEPLGNPFEETAPWELEVPRDVSPPAPVREPLPVTAAPVREAHAPIGRGIDGAAVPELREAPTSLPRLVEEGDVHAHDRAMPPEFTRPMAPPTPVAHTAPAPDEETRALDHADAFMRALGVTLPQLEPATPAAGSLEAMIAESMPAAHEAPQAHEAPAPLQPPPAPMPPAVAIPEAQAQPPHAKVAERQAPEAQARRAAPAVIERRQVVVVTQPGGTGAGQGVTPGAGAPRFGLGQL